MKFSDILLVNPNPNFFSGTPSSRKILLEGGGIFPNEESISDEDETETNFESEAESETFSKNAYETFIAPTIQNGNGYFFPRR
ncbi:MAG: hypothetical protein ACK5UE_06385 [Chitinophagales bacterium]|jgi:hypothetical protein|nr:hypothetical protein [Sphingobacteriales bacterium]